MTDYSTFLANKKLKAKPLGIEPSAIPKAFFEHQVAATEFCLRQGRAALFLDTGLGKTLCELEFARQAIGPKGSALILCPLSITRQIEAEGAKFGYKAKVIREQKEMIRGINICNYDRLDKLDASAYKAVILDESSCLKSFMGKTTQALIASFADTPFRLCATATPAPNDYIEIGTHCEFLGVMSQAEMLARFFVHDSANTQEWRLKGHAAEAFWDWVASWAVMASSPDDLGFDGSRYILPPFETHQHKTIGDTYKPVTSGFFAAPVSATTMHATKRQTSAKRAEKAYDIVGDNREPWVIWCDTNDEQDYLELAFGSSAISIRGSQSPEVKEELHIDWLAGKRPILIVKPSMFGFGVNWQRCRQTIFVGRSFSYESWYQAIRRLWRFGQEKIVQVHIIVADGEDQIGRVIDRKSDAHAAMKAAMVAASRRALNIKVETKIRYNPQYELEMPEWLTP